MPSQGRQTQSPVPEETPNIRDHIHQHTAAQTGECSDDDGDECKNNNANESRRSSGRASRKNSERTIGDETKEARFQTDNTSSDDEAAAKWQRISRAASVRTSIGRRMSMGLSAVMNPQELRNSTSGPKKLRPTYRMGPVEGHQFNYKTAKHIVVETTDSYLDGLEYSAKDLSGIIKKISSRILSKLKRQDFQRYKYVCHVTAVQLRGQGVHVVDRQVMDQETDQCVCITKQCHNYVVIVTLHALFAL